MGAEEVGVGVDGMPKFCLSNLPYPVSFNDSSSPGLPAGTLPEARGRGDAVVNGAVYLPPHSKENKWTPRSPPAHCHSKSLAPQPAKVPPRLLAGGRTTVAGEHWPGEGLGFRETAVRTRYRKALPTPIVCLSD